MTTLLHNCRSTLLNKILQAGSQEEVKFLFEQSARSFGQAQVPGLAVNLFWTTLADDLTVFNPMRKNAQQWSNIKLAKILLNRINHPASPAVNQQHV